MGRVREIRRVRRRVRIGAPDASLTRFSGAIAVTELVDRLAMIKLLDAAIGPIKSRDRGFSGGDRSRRCRRACALGVGQHEGASRPVGLHPGLDSGRRGVAGVLPVNGRG